MKKTATLLLSAALALGAIGSAQADWGRHDRYTHHHHGHHHGGSRWAAPAAVLAITGLALGAAAYHNAYAAPAPVYTAPPPNPNVWYYCGSSGQYYPYTRACPEGWQAVPAR